MSSESRAEGGEAGGRPKILVIGDVMTDILVRPEGPLVTGADRRASIRVAPGGSGANQAAWLAALGVAAAFAGRVGQADHAHQRQLLLEAGVEPVLAADEALPTGTIVTLLSADGERSFLTDRGANTHLCRADLPDWLLDGADLVHVSGYSLFSPGPRAAVLDLVAEARRRKVPISVDAASHSLLAEIGAERFLAWTGGASLCFANASEAEVLAGAPDPDAQIATLTRAYPLVVIKTGAEGALAGDASGARWSARAPAVEAIDTSGAGDTFCAAFLSAFLRGGGIEDCLRAGVAAGSRAVTILGGRPPAGEDGGQTITARMQ